MLELLLMGEEEEEGEGGEGLAPVPVPAMSALLASMQPQVPQQLEGPRPQSD